MYYQKTTNHLTLLTKGKRSQSALEYMMTYGWAILIIVIVAVILYSMGIFNPSSSISTTITGFSSTPVSSAIFTDNGGLSLSVQNSVGYPIEITNITATTTTGGKVTIEPNITLLPGKSQVLVLSKVFTASSQNSDISTAVVSTGSITGSTLAVIYPANYTFAAVSKLTITNTQSSATSNPFQQMVNITSADNGWQLISPDFGQNVEFFYYNGTVIPSWLESYTSTNAIWWLKIAAIPAGSSETVYVGFAPTTTNLFNTVNDGEAPQLSPIYAEYDNGKYVFPYYWNFAGTSLPSGFSFILLNATNAPEIGGYSVDNGITVYNQGSGSFTGSAFNVSYLYLADKINMTGRMVEAFMTGIGNSDNSQANEYAGLLTMNNLLTTSDSNGEYTIYNLYGNDATSFEYQSGTTIAPNTGASITSNYPMVLGLDFINSTNASGIYNGSEFATGYSTGYTGEQYVGLFASADGTSGINSYTSYEGSYLFITAQLVNGMPTFTIGN